MPGLRIPHPYRRRRWPLRVWAEVAAARLMGAYGGQYDGGRCCFRGHQMLLTREIAGVRRPGMLENSGRFPRTPGAFVTVQLVWRCPPCLATAQQWTERFDADVDTEAHT